MSVAIGAVLLFGSGRLLRSGVHILMEGVPEGVSLPDVARVLAVVPGVKDVHDLHIWNLCPGSIALSAHVTVEDHTRETTVRLHAAFKEALRARFGIEHTTIQLECARCAQGVVAGVGDRQR
jgi:cobalt-zinc-cadmium efflux system protein